MAICSNTWITAMVVCGFVLMAGLTIGLVVTLSGSAKLAPTFTVDHVNNTFLMDGEPFRYVSGSFHYFRAMSGAWQERLHTMRAAGLNALDTYVEWSLHNPRDGVYNFEGMANIEQFLDYANAEGFYVILRPGPYVCAERDNGGLPHWLFTKYPGIKVRTSDENYQSEVASWLATLMPRVQHYFYGNGGPIIMVQVENEYGAYHACDKRHTLWLRDEIERYVQGKALLFTTDIPDERMKCGKIEGVFATTDFGIDRIHEVDSIWRQLRQVQPTGPLVNSEFYPGWLTHWQEDNQRRDSQQVADALRIMLQQGANVNFYMFFGGTNFGFTAGANDWGYGGYMADITSYDYDAVMDEAGNVTEKYDLVRQVISDYFQIPEDRRINGILRAPSQAYGRVQMRPILALLSEEGRAALADYPTVRSELPQTFEDLDLQSGLVLYETQLPMLEIDPTLLTVECLRDRALVYVDGYFVGTLSRQNAIYSLPLNKGWGSTLQLLVENQGRINFNVGNDTKGIMGAVTVQRLNGDKQELFNWTSTAFPLNNVRVQSLMRRSRSPALRSATVLTNGPVLYYGEFDVTEPRDTYLNPTGWGKGVAYVNDFNLGRYWPLVGPQITLYVPRDVLRAGTNTLVLVEYQRASEFAQFDAIPQLDGLIDPAH